ncbi:MAG: pilus assembly protein TadG-related protein [Pseudomonadota bacterium]
MEFKTGIGGYARDHRGATAVVFALCLVPILLVVGFAVDFAMHQGQKAKVQHALDMAGLAAAKHMSTNLSADLDDVETLARDYFKAELDGDAYISMNDVTLARSGLRLNLEVDGTMPTSFMQLAGVATMPLSAEAEIVYSVPTSSEVVLVLDTSTSMSVTDSGETESRIESLKTAARDMISVLLASDATIDVKMGVVPFSNQVNIGTDQAGASWLSVPADVSQTRDYCRITTGWYEANCTRDTYACSDDDVDGACGTWNCDGVDTSAADRECTTYTITHSWHGCVKPRSDLYHLSDGFYSMERIPGILSRDARQCASQVQPLTDNTSDLNRTINTLAVRSETYIPSGLIWGFRMLSQRRPFATDQSIEGFRNSGGVKTIVLMSDGANTLAPEADGTISDADITEADPNTRAVCQTIKDAGVEIFVVAYNISDVTTTTLLNTCASSDSRFFEASSTDELKAVFESIAQQISRDISIVG